MTEPALEDPTGEAAAPQRDPDSDHAPLRAAFAAVLVMTVVFVAAWATVFAIAMERRG